MTTSPGIAAAEAPEASACVEGAGVLEADCPDEAEGADEAGGVEEGAFAPVEQAIKVMSKAKNTEAVTDTCCRFIRLTLLGFFSTVIILDLATKM